MFDKIYTGVITLELKSKFKNFYDKDDYEIFELSEYLKSYPDRLAAYVWIIDNFYVYGSKKMEINNIDRILYLFNDLLPKIKEYIIGGVHLVYDVEIET